MNQGGLQVSSLKSGRKYRTQKRESHVGKEREVGGFNFSGHA